MNTSVLFSSNGEVHFDIENGIVIEIKEEGPEFFISNIGIIDIKEWKEYYKLDIPTEGLDILDVGFWLIDGQYVPPDQIWRDEFNTK